MSPAPDPDLHAVDELCRLALVARRLGCRVRLLDASVELTELVRLAGVSDVLLAEPTTPSGDLR